MESSALSVSVVMLVGLVMRDDERPSGFDEIHH